jgi:hypothetical protein
MIYTEEIYTCRVTGVYRVQLQIVRKELNPEMPGGKYTVSFDLV